MSNNELNWYHEWHNHPRHKHAHWLILSLVLFLVISIISIELLNFGLENKNIAQAQSNRCTSNNFNGDPAWIGENNLPNSGECKQVSQDYGYAASNLAGGSPGELGGLFSRTLTRSYYGDSSLGNLTFNSPIKFSGQFAITRGDDGYIFLGFFNSQEQGWRPPNFLGFHVGADKGVANLLVDYTSSQWGAGGTGEITVGPSNGIVHNFTFDYAPTVGNGLITLTLDGAQHQLALTPEHRAQGANFNRFGVFHLARTAGATVNAYFDNLRYTTGNGEKFEQFNSDPGWEWKGNRSNFLDCETYGNQDFGYRGGNIGGLFHRIDADTRPVYYADNIPTLTQNDYLEAQGILVMTMGNADSGMQIGWFNDRFEAKEGGTLSSIGAIIEGPSAIGHYFQAAVKPSGQQFYRDSNPSASIISRNFFNASN